MPYWAEGLAWLVLWSALGMAVRPLIHRSREHK